MFWVLAVLLTGCGVPGDPLPPLLEIPAPISDLNAEQIGASAVLRFSRPELTTEGTLIRFLDRIEIHGAFLPAGSAPEAFSGSAQLLATIPAAQLPHSPGPIVYPIPLAASHAGTVAMFALKAINHRQMDAGFSNMAAIEVGDLPEPPQGLRAVLTALAIELKWSGAGRSAFGGPAPTPDGYEIYRADASSPLPPQLIGTAEAPSYEDRTFAFGTNYTYTVRAFIRGGEAIARTPESNRVEIAAVDRFPPAAPQNLRAVAVSGAVDLVWSPGTDTDLAGYNLYRSAAGPLIRLNSELLVVPLYRDSAVSAGTSYRYQVKAVDSRGNESAPSGEAVATAE